MNEVKIYGAILATLMVLSYLSFHEEEGPTETAVTLWDVSADDFEALKFTTETQTVALSLEKKGNAFVPEFAFTTKKVDRKFYGNDKVDGLLKNFAPFHALRSLGSNLSDELLKRAGLDAPKSRLSITVGGRTRAFEVGGQTTGARDYYVRREGQKEVFLVASKTLRQLTAAETRFFQRKFRNVPQEKVARLTVNGLNLLRRDDPERPEKSIWVNAANPEGDHKTFTNYVTKLERLNILEYIQEEDALKGGTPVLTAEWFGDDDQSLGTVKLYRSGTPDKPDYRAEGALTHGPVKVSKFSAEQLEKNLKDIVDAAK